MLVRITNTYVGEGRALQVGQLADLEDEIARDAIKRGRAEPIAAVEQRQTALNPQLRKREKRAQ